MARVSFIEGWDTTLAAVQKLVGHPFRDQELLFQALTHSSFSNEHWAEECRTGASATPTDTAAPPLADNERLEFLGDAVIGLVMAKVLMERYPAACEGRLSRWRSNLVSRRTLAEIAAGIGLGEHLLLGRGERRTGGAEKRSILAAGMEAVVGAVYLDGGLERASAFLCEVFGPWLDALREDDSLALSSLDTKTHLQERTQSRFRATPVYRLVDAWGPEHEKHFRVEILIEGKVVASGDGRSKKEAEQTAARLALETLEL